jgi:hypothetical protein
MLAVKSKCLANELLIGLFCGEFGVDIARILSEPDRSWKARPPADLPAVSRLQESAHGELPAEYINLLLHCNGGEGPLALPPRYFMLDSAEYSFELNMSVDQRDLYPGLFVFGSNGGLELIAFDTRDSRPWPIAMYDPIAGIESAVIIAKNMEEFIFAVGLDFQDRHGG